MRRPFARWTRVLGVALVGFAGLITARAPAQGDSWLPYKATRYADPSGRFALAVEPTSNGNVLSPGRTGPRGRYQFVEVVSGVDVIRGEGELDELPLEVRIAPGGRGFAALGAWAGDGRGRCVVLADARGAIRRALTLVGSGGAQPSTA